MAKRTEDGMGEELKRFTLFGVVAIALLGWACGRGEIKGTYAVDLEIAGIPTPLSGTLILSTQLLDLPSLSESDESIDPNWFGGDEIAANSCFILEPGKGNEVGAEAGPQFVRVFETRLLPNGIATPLEILNASDLRIEISALQFFANTLGGQLDVHTERDVLPGRIHGSRTGSAAPQRCIEALDAFRLFLRGEPQSEGIPD